MEQGVIYEQKYFQSQGLSRENQLLEACRILFGEDILLSSEFLHYLQEEGVSSAYRKRAIEIHPDKAMVSGRSVAQCEEEFHALKVACEMLRNHIVSKKIQSRRTAEKRGREKGGQTCPYALPQQKLPFGRFLYRIGVIEWRQLVEALAWQKSGRMKIGELGVSLGYLDRDSVFIILKNSRKGEAFGLTAEKLGLLSSAEVNDLLDRQRRTQKKIGQFFVEKGLLTSLELYQLLNQCREHNQRIEKLSDK